MALESQGINVFFSTSTAAFSTAHRVEQVVSITGPGGAAAVIDVTSLSDSAKAKMMGLPDEGQITIEAYLGAMTSGSTGDGQVKMRTARANRTKGKLKVKLTDASSYYLGMDCYVTNFSVSAAVDQAVKLSITCEISGAVAYTTE